MSEVQQAEIHHFPQRLLHSGQIFLHLMYIFHSKCRSYGSCLRRNPSFVALQQRRRQFSKSSVESRGSSSLFFCFMVWFYSVINFSSWLEELAARIGVAFTKRAVVQGADPPQEGAATAQTTHPTLLSSPLLCQAASCEWRGCCYTVALPPLCVHVTCTVCIPTVWGGGKYAPLSLSVFYRVCV